MMLCVEESDLPSLYREADAESKAAQASYLRVFVGIVTATVLAASGSWYASDFENRKLLISLFAAGAMVIATILTYILSERRYEQTWYMGRAIAESIKTRSWSYMMCSEPYSRDLSSEEVNQRLIDDIRKILTEKGPLILANSNQDNREIVTARMTAVRMSSVEVRLETYLQCRVGDQRSWYGTKARQSSQSGQRSFNLMQLSQVISVLIALYFIYEKRVTSGSVAVLATLSGCILAWLQVKKYQETSQSYSVACQELGLIEALGRDVKDEQQLTKFVTDAENAVSREHTLWIARRITR